ncbi:MAG TPA: DUF4129 domain-containing protein [Pyrinomonadaceae bacterium]|nr:DUF4129 domain-containing protein [Pyrinomonadaceae bacterium]
MRAVAVPLSEYQNQLDHIIGDLQSLTEKEENESATDFESRFTETVEAMRSEFPKSQQVELGNGTSATADNTWFHTLLDDLQRAPVEQRAEKLSSMVASLTALEKRVSDLASATEVDANKAADKQKLDSILARPEYAAGARGPNALTRMIEDFLRWFRNLFPDAPEIQPGRANVISSIIQIIVVLLALALITYVLVILLRRFKVQRKSKVTKSKEPRIVLGERLQPEDTATDLLAEAEALARRGDLRAAIRKGYIALLVELGDRKLISLAQYKTNRDYLRSVSNMPQLHLRLAGMTDSFERHWYGFAQATPNDWQDFRASYREALQTAN